MSSASLANLISTNKLTAVGARVTATAFQKLGLCLATDCTFSSHGCFPSGVEDGGLGWMRKLMRSLVFANAEREVAFHPLEVPAVYSRASLVWSHLLLHPLELSFSHLICALRTVPTISYVEFQCLPQIYVGMVQPHKSIRSNNFLPSPGSLPLLCCFFS